LPFYSFSADSPREHPSLHAERVSAISYVAHFLGPPTPNGVTTDESRVVDAFER